MKLLIASEPIPPARLFRLVADRAPEFEVIADPRQLPDAALADVDAMLAWRIPDGLLPRLPRLRLLCSTGAGAEKVLVPELSPSVAVSRIADPRVNDGIAQYVAAMALAHARDLPRYARQQRERSWTRTPIDRAEPTVLVLGLGGTGLAIARALAGLGFRVEGWSTRARPDLPYRTHVGQPGLATGLASADLVVIALPLTPDTRGLVDASFLARMPAGSYLINVARGDHVVEADLIAAVRRGHLAGAALDVQVNEPMPADDPLWTVDGITVTPHIAAQASLEVVADQFVECCRALAAGEPLPRRLDRERGY